MSILTKNPAVGIISFIIILFSMALGHTGMIMMETIFGKEHINMAAVILGIIGLLLLVYGIVTVSKTKATILGLFGGIFIWTGWIEFAFVYYANRYHIAPLTVVKEVIDENGVSQMIEEVVTKPEYLLMPSSVGLWAVYMIFYFFGSKTGCTFFTWFQSKMKLHKKHEFVATKRNTALSTFMEVIILMWTFYLLLLFAYDANFFGDRHWVTYFIAFGSLFWTLFLVRKLWKIKSMDYAIKYALPTVIIFWNFIEIMGRWDFFKEFWIEPEVYWLEMSLIFVVFIIFIVSALLISNSKKKKKKIQV